MKISWLPPELIPAGRLGLTHSPGCGDATRDQDLQALRNASVTHIVCMQEAFELRYSDMDDEDIPMRAAAVKDFGMRFTHCPVVDHGVGAMQTLSDLVATIRDDLARGDVVIVHCFAGLGRAGTTAACVLVADGMAPASAILEVREARPGAIQSDAQENFIHDFAKRS